MQRSEGSNQCASSVYTFYLKLALGVKLVHNVVLVSGVQHSESVIYIHVPLLFQILSPYRLLQNIE